MSFPPPIESLTLRVTTGVYPDVQPFEQTILSANMGSNSIPIHNTSLTSAFNTQPPGTIFNASIVTTYNEGTFTTGDTISTPSLLNFVPKPLVLSNFGPFIYNYVSGGVGTFTLPQPSSNSNSPGAFTYSVVDTNGVVSVSTNVVTMLSAGTTTIRATQAAAGSYTSAFVNASVTINPIAPTFSNGGVFTIANKNFGSSPFTPTYLTSNSSGAFTYTSSTPSVASVHSTTGVVTIVSAGTTTIRATQAAAGNYTSAYFEASVTVDPIAPTFSNGGVFTISSKNFGDASFTPTYLTSNSSGAFTYTSSTPSVATVNSTTGLVTIVSAGTTTIRATQAAAGNYTTAYVEASFTVNTIAPTFSNGGVFTISSKNFGDASFTPTYLTSNSSGAFTYTSITPSVASVHSTTGLVTIISAGTTTIRATQTAAGNYTSAYVEASFTVNPIAPTFSNGGVFTISSKDLGAAPFTPDYLTSNSSGAFTYTSITPSVATVNSTTGLVTIISAGTTTIRATQTAAGNYTSAYVEASFTVTTWSQRGQDINGEAAGDYSGWSVSLSSSGNTLAVGAIYNDGSGSSSGHTRVYDWNTVAWAKRGSDINGEAAGDYSGISVSLSSDGNTLAIGAVYNDSAGSNAGHVRVYYWDTVATPNKWTKRGSDIDGESAGDFSGVSVNLSSNGNTLVVGANYNDGAGLDAGHARVYDWNTVAWTKRGSDIDGEAANDQSGVSVSISSDGNTVAIGARYNDGAGVDAGHARVYDWDTVTTPNQWTQRGQDVNGEAAGDYSGWSVSLSSDGNTVAIGAINNDANGNLLSNAGHVRVYDWDTVAWTQRGSDIDGEAAGDNSGWSVSLSSDGNRIAVGAVYNDGTGSDAGHVRVYEWNTTSWTQYGLDIDGEATGDNSGRSVKFSSDGNTVAVGAVYNDGNGTSSGHARVFKYE